MSFSTFVALRYLFSKKTHPFVKFLAWLSMIGIFISVVCFIVVHSVMNGFNQHLQQALMGFNAEIQITTNENQIDLSSYKKIFSKIQTYKEFDGLTQSETTNQIAGVRVRGISNEDLKNLNANIQFFEGFSILDFKEGLIIGAEVANRLQLVFGYPEKIKVVNPVGDVSPNGELAPMSGNYRVIGFFNSGFYDFDSRYVLLSKDNIQKFSSETLKDKTHLWFKKSQDMDFFKKEFISKYPELKIQTWLDNNKRYFKALKLERLGMFLVLSLLMLIASGNILGMVTLTMLGKKREMAIFYALGLTQKQIKILFIKMGAFIGIISSSAALIASLGLLFYLNRYPLPLPPAYYLDELPIKTDFILITFVFLLAPFFTIVASLIPVRQIRNIKPVEILRQT